MALTVRMLSLVSRLGAPSALNTWSCRFKSRDASATVWADHQSHTHSRASDRRPRRQQELFEEDADMEDVEDKLQEIIDEERKRQKAVKYHKTMRQMTPSGAPERKLSWVSMEQIRYLKQEQPEEWTVERLAEGFSVTPDVILRVLKSKFNPVPERKAKQDSKVMARLSQQALPPGRGQGQDRPQLPSHSTAALLPAESSASALVTLTSRQEGLVTPTSRQGLVTPTSRQGSRALAASPGGPPDSLATLPTHLSASLTVPSQPAPVTSSSNVKDIDDDEEEGWDGEVFLEEEIEELMLTAKHSPVVRVGNEFFDNGNFLYRI